MSLGGGRSSPRDRRRSRRGRAPGDGTPSCGPPPAGRAPARREGLRRRSRSTFLGSRAHRSTTVHRRDGPLAERSTEGRRSRSPTTCAHGRCRRRSRRTTVTETGRGRRRAAAAVRSGSGYARRNRRRRPLPQRHRPRGEGGERGSAPRPRPGSAPRPRSVAALASVCERLWQGRCPEPCRPASNEAVVSRRGTTARARSEGRPVSPLRGGGRPAAWPPRSRSEPGRGRSPRAADGDDPHPSRHRSSRPR